LIVSSFVIFVSQGVDAEISVNTLNDGYAIYKPVLGDMMSCSPCAPSYCGCQRHTQSLWWSLFIWVDWVIHT